MGNLSKNEQIIELDTSKPIWGRFFTISPLVVIGTKESRVFNLAPKHMVTALGVENYFGFVCTPKHSTYHNVKYEKAFTVSFPKPDQVVLAGLASIPRCDQGGLEKPDLQGIPTFPAQKINAPFLRDSYLFLECELDRIVDGFGSNSLIAGKIVAAYVDEDYLRTFEKDEQEMVYHAPMLAYLAQGRFAEVRDTLAFPFPKNFKS